MELLLTLFAVCTLHLVPQEEGLDAELTGVWIVDVETRQHHDGRRTTLNGNKFVVLLPERVVILRPFQRRDGIYDFSILGKSDKQDGHLLLLCKDREGRMMRLKLDTDNNQPVELTLILRTPYPELIEEPDQKRRTVKIDGEWKPVPSNQEVAAVKYALKEASPAAWGVAFTSRFAHQDKTRADVEISRFVSDWANTEDLGEFHEATESR